MDFAWYCREPMLVSQRWGVVRHRKFPRFSFWKTTLSLHICVFLSPYWGIDIVKLFAALIEMFQLFALRNRFIGASGFCSVQIHANFLQYCLFVIPSLLYLAFKFCKDNSIYVCMYLLYICIEIEGSLFGSQWRLLLNRKKRFVITVCFPTLAL